MATALQPCHNKECRKIFLESPCTHERMNYTHGPLCWPLAFGEPRCRELDRLLATRGLSGGKDMYKGGARAFGMWAKAPLPIAVSLLRCTDASHRLPPGEDCVMVGRSNSFGKINSTRARPCFVRMSSFAPDLNCDRAFSSSGPRTAVKSRRVVSKPLR